MKSLRIRKDYVILTNSHFTVRTVMPAFQNTFRQNTHSYRIHMCKHLNLRIYIILWPQWQLCYYLPSYGLYLVEPCRPPSFALRSWQLPIAARDSDQSCEPGTSRNVVSCPFPHQRTSARRPAVFLLCLLPTLNKCVFHYIYKYKSSPLISGDDKITHHCNIDILTERHIEQTGAQ